MEAINWLTANWDDVVLIILQVIGALSIIAKLTPTPKDDAILSKVVGILNALALNTKPKETPTK